MPYIEKLKMIKDEKGLSNAEIAKIADTPLATVTRVFNGQTPNPTFETISRIAISMGTSLDELVGLKQPDESPMASRIENTLNTYSSLLVEKDERIKELKEDLYRERKERYKMTGALLSLAIFVSAVLAILAVDLLNGQFGMFRY